MSPRPRPRPRPRNSYIGTPQLPFPFPECKIGMQKSSSSTFLHSTIKSACFASKCLTYIHIQQVRVPCLAFLSFPSALGFSILVLPYPTLPTLGQARFPINPSFSARFPLTTVSAFLFLFSYFLIFYFFSLSFFLGGGIRVPK